MAFSYRIFYASLGQVILGSRSQKKNILSKYVCDANLILGKVEKILEVLRVSTS